MCSTNKCMPPGPVANNGFLNFLRVYRKKNCNLSAQEVVQRGALAWNCLSESTKSKYRRMGGCAPMKIPRCRPICPKSICCPGPQKCLPKPRPNCPPPRKPICRPCCPRPKPPKPCCPKPKANPCCPKPKPKANPCCPKPKPKANPCCPKPKPKANPCCPKPKANPCCPKPKPKPCCPKPKPKPCCPKPKRRAKSCGSRRKKCAKPGPITNNGYLNFLRWYRKKHCGMRPDELILKGARRWCALSQEKKDRFNRMACKVSTSCRRRNTPLCRKALAPKRKRCGSS